MFGSDHKVFGSDYKVFGSDYKVFGSDYKVFGSDAKVFQPVETSSLIPHMPMTVLILQYVC